MWFISFIMNHPIVFKRKPGCCFWQCTSPKFFPCNINVQLVTMLNMVRIRQWKTTFIDLTVNDTEHGKVANSFSALHVPFSKGQVEKQNPWGLFNSNTICHMGRLPMIFFPPSKSQTLFSFGNAQQETTNRGVCLRKWNLWRKVSLGAFPLIWSILEL